MKTIDGLILEIKTKRDILERKIKTTRDQEEIQEISSSLRLYLEMELYLAQLGIMIGDDSKDLLCEDIYKNKLFLYTISSHLSFGYLREIPDLEYVKSLLDIIVSSYSFSTPSLEITNQEILELTKNFYQMTFSNIISEKVIKLMEQSYVLFFEKVSDDFPYPALGICWQDHYYQDIYLFIQRQHDISDYSSLSHEAFHGFHFQENPNIRKSVVETQEVGAYMIEYLYYDFLLKHSISSGNILKKLCLMTISNEAFMFKKILDTGEYNHMQMVHVLLYLETRVIGYGMAKEYMKNPVEGEQKLMQYMNHCFPKDVLPDYSPLGYSKETILKTAEQFVEERDELLKPHYQKSL